MKQIARQLEPDPSTTYWIRNIGRNVRINIAKATATGMNLRPVAETIVQTVEYFIAKHLLDTPSVPRVHCVI